MIIVSFRNANSGLIKYSKGSSVIAFPGQQQLDVFDFTDGALIRITRYALTFHLNGVEVGFTKVFSEINK
jgi:hypothetical protein